MDLDVMEPTIYVLKKIFPLVERNGVIILDNYNVIKGETKAIKTFIKENKIKLNKINYLKNFYYISK